VLSYYLIKTATWDPVSLGFVYANMNPSLYIFINIMPAARGHVFRHSWPCTHLLLAMLALGCRAGSWPCWSQELKMALNPVCFSWPAKILHQDTLVSIEW